MILKTPFGYIDLFGTCEGRTLIGAVVLIVALVWWCEWGKVKCFCVEIKKLAGLPKDTPCCRCHGSGRVRRGWVSGLFRQVFHFLQMGCEDKHKK